MKLKTILSKPIPVVWYRFVQLVKIKIYKHIGFWHYATKSIAKNIWDDKPVWNNRSKLFHNKKEFQISQNQKDHYIKEANNILNGYIKIFNKTYHFSYPLIWNIDWRFNHIWVNNYYKSYSFYLKKKSKPHDVKFPWELSRLSFLIIVARAYKFSENPKYLKFIIDTLKDWKSKNPLANSVNWYAMEASVRIINLIQLRELIIESKKTKELLTSLNEILLIHGVFLWRNIEYTDVRGNHYTANLTALLLLGITFKGKYFEAKKWLNYSIKRIEKEFHLQFKDNGVNFEMSIPYHRLVIEFYLISFLVLQRSGNKLQEETIEKFKRACLFIKDYTKPDLTAPIIGDNDSASVFQHDGISLNNHSNILQLAALFFNDNEFNITISKYLSSIELFGRIPGYTRKKHEFGLKNYLKDGFAIIKNKNNYFISDFGEVGMNGRGGHGHNDLFSFELFLNGKNLVIDPGCFTYTGNLEIMNKFKSSFYHNGLTVDNQEIAPFISQWKISDIAKPQNILHQVNKEEIIIEAEHYGYKKLKNPLTHNRKFKINIQNFSVECIDTISCIGNHIVCRHLHFVEGVDLSLNKEGLVVSQGKMKYLITYDTNSDLFISDYSLSYNYGSKTIAKKATIKNIIHESIRLSLTINDYI